MYLAESNVFNVLALRFGDLGQRENRRKLLDVWLASKLFRASGLEAKEIEKTILEQCRHAGDFLRLAMEEIARTQGMRRWAENSPEGLLHLPVIKALIPDALVVHILRDGRDVASSLAQVKYVRPFPWDQRQGLLGSGVYWEWIVQRGRAGGQALGADYLEVRFEDLLSEPQRTLDEIGRFIDHDLNYEVIRKTGYGSVSKPNTSFKAESPSAGFSPVGRWKKIFSPQELFRFEAMTGATLQQLGYTLVTDGASRGMTPGMRLTRGAHRSFFFAKLWFKQNSLVRALRPPLTSMEIDQTVLGEDHAPEIRRVSTPVLNAERGQSQD